MFFLKKQLDTTGNKALYIDNNTNTSLQQQTQVSNNNRNYPTTHNHPTTMQLRSGHRTKTTTATKRSTTCKPRTAHPKHRKPMKVKYSKVRAFTCPARTITSEMSQAAFYRLIEQLQTKFPHHTLYLRLALDRVVSRSRARRTMGATSGFAPVGHGRRSTLASATWDATHAASIRRPTPSA